ncbi:hypothetical protein Acr_04g0008530 [Actinidia rufa]|uniref:Uncharacterized protein n=1 Tax=Actinidia rufa TaxID=165716 RepID=A0A7J0EI04_9ERIC|nr:hypothetical protein Acr_04g0008530 [Actinidia rufa]
MERARRSPEPELGADTTRDNATRVKAYVTLEMSLISVFGTTTALKAWARGNGRQCSQGILGDKGRLARQIVSVYEHMLSSNMSSEGTVSASCHVLNQDTKGNNTILKEGRFPKTAPAAVLTIPVLADRALLVYQTKS